MSGRIYGAQPQPARMQNAATEKIPPVREQRPSSMALLHRFVKANDRFDTNVFTFVIPNTITKDFSPDVISRDFMYGHQKWCVIIIRSGRHVDTYLRLRNVTDGMTVYVDYSFTFINREHFTKNESYAEKEAEFNSQKHTNGRSNFIGINDLSDRGFQANDKYVVELEMRNIRTFFDEMLQLPRDLRDQNRMAQNFDKFETSYFAFGGSDWTVSIYPFGDRRENENKAMVSLNRQTSFDHCAKIKFQVFLGQNERSIQTDILEDFVDISGYGSCHALGTNNIFGLTSHKHKLRIRVQLHYMAAISEIQVCPLDRRKNKVRLYDRDKQAWMLEADPVEKDLRIRLYYMDIFNIPRHYSRYVCWSMCVKPARSNRRPIRALGAPFTNYYTQKDADDGFEMKTSVKVADMTAPESIYLEEGKKLTVQVEWLESHLLLYDQYHRFDDTSRLQTHQMRRELEVLQAENYALEKQVHSYQQSIAKNHAKGRFTKDHLVSERNSASKTERSKNHRDSSPSYHRDRDRDSIGSPTTNYSGSEKYSGSANYTTDKYGATVDKYSSSANYTGEKYSSSAAVNYGTSEKYSATADKYSSSAPVNYTSADKYGSSSEKYGVSSADKYGSSADKYGVSASTDKYGVSASTDKYGVSSADKYGSSHRGDATSVSGHNYHRGSSPTISYSNRQSPTTYNHRGSSPTISHHSRNSYNYREDDY